MKIYPNRANEHLYIDMTSQDVEEIALYDISGRKVVFNETYSKDGIDVKELPDGVYIVVVKTQWAIFKQKLLV